MLSRRMLLSTTVVAGLVLSQSDCTMVGAGLGELIDATTARSLTPQELATETLEPGQRITLHLRNGRSIEGRYIAIVPLPADEYAARYVSTRERQPAAGPQRALVLRTTAAGSRAGLQRRVPLDRVALIEWDSDQGRKVGTIIGGVIDAVALVYVTAAMAACGGRWSGFGY